MRTQKNQIVYMIGDFVSVIAAVLLTIGLRSDWSAFSYLPQSLIVMLCAFMGSYMVIAGLILGSYKSIWVYVGFGDILRQTLIVTLLSIAAILVKIQWVPAISFSDIILNWLLLAFFTCGIRMISRLKRWIAAMLGSRNGNTRKTIIIGAGAAGSMIVKRLCTNTSDGIFPVAMLDDDISKLGSRLSGIPVCGQVKDIKEVAKKYAADEILIAIPSATSKQLDKIYDHCLEATLPVKIFQSVVDGDLYMHGRKFAIKEVSIESLLWRDTFTPDIKKISSFVAGKTVLVTGGAGSIGSELCQQVLQYGCKHLIIFDINENGLFKLSEKLRSKHQGSRYTLCIGSIQDKARIDEIFRLHKPQIVLHAAAHKHVPLMEVNVAEAVKNNIFGTHNIISACIKHRASRFILISTDKAVHPTSVMGATKRISELQVQAMNGKGCELAAVRFGNVLGSNGSVVPTFREQIALGGHVTVTHKDITRFFMTISEAVSLVLCAGAQAKGGEIFVLDMGKPVRIYDLACKMIKLSGFEPNIDIPIKITGLRPGEKLYEELYFDCETVCKTQSEKIFVLSNGSCGYPDLDVILNELQLMVSQNANEHDIKQIIFSLAENYYHNDKASFTLAEKSISELDIKLTEAL